MTDRNEPCPREGETTITAVTRHEFMKGVIASGVTISSVAYRPAAAAEGARPLNFNHFKIPLMENLVKRAVRSAGIGSPRNLRGRLPAEAP